MFYISLIYNFFFILVNATCINDSYIKLLVSLLNLIKPYSSKPITNTIFRPSPLEVCIETILVQLSDSDKLIDVPSSDLWNIAYLLNLSSLFF